MLPIRMFAMQNLLEDERRLAIYNNNLERRIMRNESDPFSLSDIRFIELFRLTKEMVQYVIQQLVPHMPYSQHPNAITPDLKIFAVLFFYATGSYQRTVGQSYLLSMSQNIISTYVKEVSNLIVAHLSDYWIILPTTEREKIKIKQRFMQSYNFPGVIGALDCTHVAIIAPNQEEHNYINRKGYHSKNVQIVCDADLKILNINARYAGATHDSYIWRHSIIHQELRECYNFGDHTSWLLGDSGYPQQPWLMTPVLNANPGSPEDRYTQRHILARNCIERCNGVLKSRFRCIHGERVLRYDPERVGNIIIACAVLHNICTEGRLEVENILPQVGDNLANDEEFVNLGVNEGQAARQTLIDRYF